MLLGAAVKEKYRAGLQGAPARLLAERRPLSFPLLCCVGWQPLKIGTVPPCGACLCLSSLTFVKSGLVFPSVATGRGCEKCPPRRGGLVRLRAPCGAELCHRSRCRMVPSCFFVSSSSEETWQHLQAVCARREPQHGAPCPQAGSLHPIPRQQEGAGRAGGHPFCWALGAGSRTWSWQLPELLAAHQHCLLSSSGSSLGHCLGQGSPAPPAAVAAVRCGMSPPVGSWLSVCSSAPLCPCGCHT